MATKEHKRQASGVIAALETRVHAGPPIHDHEIHAAREFLRQHDFSPASDYFRRLAQVQDRLRTRTLTPVAPQPKRNYGGSAAGYQMQLQCIYDHLILSTCYDGEFRSRRGRVKISHRFNEQGRIDFIELKFLRSLHPALTGELRKLVMVRDYQSIPKNWYYAQAYVLPALPQELIFLYADLFRSPREEIVSWLANIGHGLVADLLGDLGPRQRNGHAKNQLHWSEAAVGSPELVWVTSPAAGSGFAPRLDVNGSGAVQTADQPEPPAEKRSNQLPLTDLPGDDVAMGILERAANLQCGTEPLDHKTVRLRYVHK